MMTFELKDGMLINMIDLQASKKNPYDSVIFIIDTWCKENYYSSFLVTLKIDGKLTTEYLYFDTGDPNNPDPHWVWETDWWEGEKDVMLVGFANPRDIFIYGSPKHYRSILHTEER